MTKRINSTTRAVKRVRTNVSEVASDTAPVGFPEDFWELVRTAGSVARQEISDRRQHLRSTRSAQQERQQGVPMPANFFENSVLAAPGMANQGAAIVGEAWEDAPEETPAADTHPAVPNASHSVAEQRQSQTVDPQNPATPIGAKTRRRITVLAARKPATDEKSAVNETDRESLANQKLADQPQVATAEEVAGPFQVTASSIANKFQYLENLALSSLSPNLDEGTLGHWRDEIAVRAAQPVTFVTNVAHLVRANAGESAQRSVANADQGVGDFVSKSAPQQLGHKSWHEPDANPADNELVIHKTADGEVARRYPVMSMKEAAYHILRQEKRPMTAKEIVAKATQQGLIYSVGKTPEATLASQINRAINMDNPPCFVKLEGRTYAINWLADKQLPAVTSPESNSSPEVTIVADPIANTPQTTLPSAEAVVAQNSSLEAKAPKMTYKEAAIYLLSREQRPMTTEELATLAIAEGLLTQIGRTPSVTIAGRLSDVYRAKTCPGLQRTGPNTYLISPLDTEQ